MQPYAWLVVSGRKTIELRKWNTSFRGIFLVHASKKIDTRACDRLDIDPGSLVTGAIIGSAVIYEVKEYKNRKDFFSDAEKHLGGEEFYAKREYGFLLKDPVKFSHSMPFKGMLNFFEVDESKIKGLEL